MQTTKAIAPEGTAPANGTELYYRSTGEGTAVITVHGGPGLGHYYLRPGMDALADEFRVVYYDQRGTGRTEVGDPDRISLAGAIEDLVALLDGLRIERANLLGHSYGGDLVAMFASRHPDRVASLVVANPGPPFDPQGRTALGAEMQRRYTPADMEELARLQSSAGFASRNPQAFEGLVRLQYTPFFNDRKVAASISYGFTEITAANFPDADRTFRDLDPPGAIAGLKAITAPTLVLHADRDPIPAAFSRQIAETIPGARYEVLEGASHFAYLENPDRFFPPVRGFLADEAR